jgi:hypothetical protein
MTSYIPGRFVHDIKHPANTLAMLTDSLQNSAITKALMLFSPYLHTPNISIHLLSIAIQQHATATAS